MKFTVLTALASSTSAMKMSQIDTTPVVTETDEYLAEMKSAPLDMQLDSEESLSLAQNSNWGLENYQGYVAWRAANKPASESSDTEPEDSDDDDNNDKPVGSQQTNEWYMLKYKQEYALERMMAEDKINIQAPASGQFIDKSFNGQNSLFKEEPNKGMSMLNSYRGYALNGKEFTFKRPSELTGNPILWGSGGDENDVKQGALGDCWFLAAISALGEFPEKIRAILPGHTSYPKDGQFKGKVWSAGKQYTVTIDDRLLVNYKYTSRLFHTKQSSHDKSWWVTIVEKLGAKTFGTYESMNGGNCYEGFQLLTGQPSLVFKPQNLAGQKLHDTIRQGDENKYPMSASCGNAVNGMVPGHAYTLLGVKGDNFLLRNPWGGDSYGKNIAGVGDNVSDGVITVPEATFRAAFYQFTINYNKDWKLTEKQASVPKSNPRQVFKFYNPIPQEVIVGLVAQNNRHFMNRQKPASDKSFALMGVRVQQGHSTPVNTGGSSYYGAFSGQGFVHFKALATGDYDFKLIEFSNQLVQHDQTASIQLRGNTKALSFK